MVSKHNTIVVSSSQGGWQKYLLKQGKYWRTILSIIGLRNGWSQEKFAELLGTSSGYVSEMENAKRNISIDYIDHIANIFKIEPHELLVNRKPVEIRRIDRGKR